MTKTFTVKYTSVTFQFCAKTKLENTKSHMWVLSKNKSAETSFWAFLSVFKTFQTLFFFLGKTLWKIMFFFIFAHFFHIHRCHNFANKIRRHDLTSFLESPSSVDFYRMFQFSTAFSTCLTNTTKFSENRNFHKKNTKIRRNSRNFEETFYFFENSIFAG